MVRVVIAMVCGLALGWSAPPLATIQDTLQKADGSRFNGFLLISRGTLNYAATAGPASDSPAALLTIGWQGRMLSATSDTVTLWGFTVVRHPAQPNP